MKNLLLIIPLVLSLMSCATRQIDYEQLEKKDGVFYAVVEDKPYSGIVTEFHPNGQLKAEGTVVNGIVEGRSRVWYQNGQLFYEHYYVDHKWEGLQYEWCESFIKY